MVTAGGLAGATALSLAGVPAGGIIGGVLGSAAVSARHEQPQALPALRVLGLVLLGATAGLRLDLRTLRLLGEVALPLAGAIACLLALNVGLAVFLNRRLGIDPVTALLAAAPGGVSEIAAIADQLGARLPTVIAIHVVRVIAVVVVVLPILVQVMRS